MAEELKRKLEKIRELEHDKNYYVEKLTNPRYSHEWQGLERERLHDAESELKEINTYYRIDF